MKNKIQIRQSSEKTDTTRLSPEHIEVGECTEMEARELLQAMVTGHNGYIISSMATETGMTTMLRMLSTRIVLEEPIWTVERYADVTFSKRRSYFTNLAERCEEAIRRHPAIKSFGAVGGGMSSRWIRLSTLAEKDFGNVIIADPKGELIAESPGAKRDKE
ncbi:hypothetical protein SAMN02745133_01998 [Desulforamulus putei DSM 12395]|uniref:Uncharacterized protein n=1 Tax=Desulforamulus putei DSM 12395 TaxID=1121429 RepID=A0A1M4ZGK9_9FIRM|nr:Flp pilus assembly complex ATPase component TadA [Desulforamulus putei]SHF17183.1 hypothetical protein SAMN02745133_01998 [Desulforamulus putei DSM 12395]